MDKNTPFSVSVNEKEWTISPEQLATFDATDARDGSFHVLKNGKAHRAEIIATDFANKTFTIKVNGTVYQSKIADKYDRLVQSIGLSLNATQKFNTIKSPMPGLVLSISVAVGDIVQKGNTLMILEAMKMENVIKAPADAVVKKIAIQKGQAVEKAQLLIEME